MDFEEDDSDDEVLAEEEEEEAATDKRGGNYDIVFKKAALLKNIMKAMQPLLDDTFSLSIGESELVLIELDKSHVAMVELRLKARWFLSYKPGARPTLAFSLQHVVEMMSRINGGFPLHMQNASWSDLQEWNASPVSRDDRPVVATAASQKDVADVTHFTYRDQYGSNVVHRLRLMVFEPNGTKPSFPDPDSVSTLRINTARLKNIIDHIRVTDPADKNAAEKAVLAIMFQEDCITFSSEYQGEVRTIHQVYTPARTEEENVKRRRILQKINRRRDRCRERSREFTLSDREREIMDMPTLDIDHSVKIHNYAGGGDYCTTRLSMKYVRRTLVNANNLCTVMFVDVDAVGLTRIRYHIETTSGTENNKKRKRSETTEAAKKRQRRLSTGSTSSSQDDTAVTGNEQDAYECGDYDDPSGVLYFWLGPKVSDDDETEAPRSDEGDNNDVDRSVQERFHNEFDDDDDDDDSD